MFKRHSISRCILVPAQVLLACGAIALLAPDVAASEPQRASMRPETRSRLSAALPPYDPSLQATAVAMKEPDPADRNPTSPEAGMDNARTTTSAATDANKPVVLPVVRVEAIRDQPRAKPGPVLPRLPETVHFKEIRPEPFESEASKEKRLEETYLSEFDRKVLNRFTLPFIGIKNADRAEEIALVEQNASTLNRMAQYIEILEAYGADANEIKAMREEYRRLYMQRSR